MRHLNTGILPLSLLVVLGLAGCGGASDGTDSSSAAPQLDDVTPQELPAGHPPLDEVPTETSPAMSIVQPPAGSGSGQSGLRWQIPPDWQPEQPDSAMRKAQYRVPGDAGDAECVVFYFGPGQGGDAMANAVRWADQFTQPDGSSSRDALLTEQIDVSGVKVLLSEVTGTYSGGMAMMGGPTESLGDYMLLGAVAEGPDANWFFKLTGPAATVKAQKAAFRGMVESLEGGG